jgi:hypothetical protein
MRGQRDKHAAEEAAAAGQTIQIIDVSEHQPRRMPSAKWRELINPPSLRLRRTFGKVCQYAPLSAVASA